MFFTKMVSNSPRDKLTISCKLLEQRYIDGYYNQYIFALYICVYIYIGNINLERVTQITLLHAYHVIAYIQLSFLLRSRGFKNSPSLSLSFLVTNSILYYLTGSYM